MQRFLFQFSFLFFLFSICVTVKSQDKRIALVIGNSAYPEGNLLTNAVNDANLMTATLQELGFEVINCTDANKSQMDSAIYDFTFQLTDADLALFFYSGHGVQVKGENYLIPIDAKLNDKLSVEIEAVKVNKVVKLFEDHPNGTNIMILDVCCNKPFRPWVRDENRGFATMIAPSGTIISYATVPGSVATTTRTVTQKNGLYTSKLATQLKQDQPLRDVFNNTRKEVVEASRGNQRPHESSQLTKTVFLKKTTPVVQSAISLAKDSITADSLDIEDSQINRNFIETVNSIDFEMVFVEGGDFLMGSDKDEDEKPVHKVTVSDFYIGKYEVTQSLWKAVMGSNPSYYEKCGGNCPVESINWHEVQDFLRKLNVITGKNYHLPSEAEWEYAAGAGDSCICKWTTNNFETCLDSCAWYSGNSGKKIHPVGKKHPSFLGIYDMSGNVWEWCNDTYDPDYYANSPSTNPLRHSPGSFKVIRGGSWREHAKDCRVTNRSKCSGHIGNSSIGFRLALTQ